MTTPKKINQEEFRIMVREILNKKLKEHDLLIDKKKNWTQEKKKMKSIFIELLKNIENDDYEEGVKKIDQLTTYLKSWKTKIQKQLNNAS